MAIRNQNFPARVVRFQKRIEKWRNSRREGERRIPESLWSAAALLALETSPYVVSRAGRLHYTVLKRRMAAVVSGRPSVKAPSGFVEVVPTVSSDPCSGSVLELSDERIRMVVRFGPEVDVNAAELVAAFRNRPE